MNKTLACAALAGLLAVGMGSAAAQTACADTDRACARAATARHPVRQLFFWQAQLALPLAQRIAMAPPLLVDYLRLDNIANGYPERPRAVQPDAAFMADLRAALAELPPVVQRLLQRKLLGLYLVEDLGGTGYTDMALDAQGLPAAGFVVLDAGVLAQRSANAWASWKEATPFKPQPGRTLQARIEDGRNDNRKNAIQYILLHELGHVLSIGENFHPSWAAPLKTLPLGTRYPFYDLSWEVDREAGKHLSLFDARFTQRPQVVYYFGAKLDAADMADVYSRLQETNFVSLYAATNPYDDFAESFASYVHTVLMHKPWQVTLLQGGKPVYQLGACWQQARCAAKRALLERLLGV